MGKLASFDDFLERRFPESRRKAYYLMSIHEHLPPEAKRELKQVGWSKGLELAKLARRNNGQDFDCATWLHKARVLPKEQFRHEVERELTGTESEPSDLMLGSDKSRGYCLEMICADFLAGANLDHAGPEQLLRSALHFYNFLSPEQRHDFLHSVEKNRA